MTSSVPDGTMDNGTSKSAFHGFYVIVRKIIHSIKMLDQYKNSLLTWFEEERPWVKFGNWMDFAQNQNDCWKWISLKTNVVSKFNTYSKQKPNLNCIQCDVLHKSKNTYKCLNVSYSRAMVHYCVLLFSSVALINVRREWWYEEMIQNEFQFEFKRKSPFAI